MKGKMKLKQNSFLLLVTILLFFIMYGIGWWLFHTQGGRCCFAACESDSGVSSPFLQGKA